MSLPLKSLEEVCELSKFLGSGVLLHPVCSEGNYDDVAANVAFIWQDAVDARGVFMKAFCSVFQGDSEDRANRRNDDIFFG